MKRFNFIALAVLAASLPFSVACASKKYVRNETAPIVNKTNELDDLTAKNTNAIRDVDARAQQGIAGVKTRADEVDQKALAANQQAVRAQSVAAQAATGVNSLTQQVANLDNYRAVTETEVHFAFNQSILSKKAKEALDQLATDIPNTKGYIVVVNGNTDATGPAEYNYVLSQRRADAVIQYLAANHQVPAHKIYVVGLGKDKPTAPNTTTEGRAKNRRVDVSLMTNVVGAAPAQSASATPQQQ